ncbi:hypothetical protein FNH04_34595 [Streptomyces phyllanthi]|uniref:Uncharacterized protein n=1 Tax=Streptomyces phyllanthi TaxID=1803180 RepID=A0A5N8WCJ1_9ACTN|nr:hypothetical protein [Streptomyces phyllanthi]
MVIRVPPGCWRSDGRSLGRSGLVRRSRGVRSAAVRSGGVRSGGVRSGGVRSGGVRSGGGGYAVVPPPAGAVRLLTGRIAWTRKPPP